MKRLPRAVAGRAILGWIGLVLLVAGCDRNEIAGLPTATSNLPTPDRTVIASPTVDPRLPTGDGSTGLVIGASNPTQAGLAAEGQPDAPQPTITPGPTQAQLPVTISGANGLILRGTFYSASVPPAPGVLLLHGRGQDRTVWDALAGQLQAAGYAVLAVDLRGYGATGGRADWALAQDDIRAVLEFLQTANSGPVAVLGASVGANLGLNACAETTACAAAVLLSPGLEYRGITTAGAMAQLGQRPVLIAASENDDNNPADSLTLDSMAAGDHQLVIYPAAGHGTEMFAAEPGLADLIAGWLLARLPPPAL